MQATYGITTTAIDIGSNVLMLEMWQEKSNPYMLTAHLFYADGTALSSLMGARFLPKNKFETNNISDNELNENLNNSASDEMIKNLWILYAINGIAVSFR